MYCNYFKLCGKPFDVTPDPRFLYMNPAYHEVLAALIYGVTERRGFITIVGEVGTGKTTLLNALIDRLEKSTEVAFVFNTDLTFKQMLLMALRDLGVLDFPISITQVEAICRLNDFAINQLSGGGNTVLIIDEAQNLNRRSLESLRLLSNLETRNNKLVQIILSGQPELDQKLSQPALRQLAQRINLRRYVFPLNEEDTYQYVEHRLQVAGYKGDSLFSDRALQLIWKYSGGIPRRINVLCDNSLLIGYALVKKKIEAKIVLEVIRDQSWSPYVRINNRISPAALSDNQSKLVKKV